MDWRAWHHDDVPDSPLSRRLRTVHAQVRAALDAAPLGPLRAVSACAGEGRDLLLGALAEQPRRGDVTALIWTRHRRPPDLVPQICRWLEERGFERQWLSEPGERWGVGVHRFTGATRPLEANLRMFTFV